MHCIFSYELQLLGGVSNTKIEQDIEEVLRLYRHVKRLSSFYIIQLNSEADWIAIFNSITDIARRYNNQLYFIISPIIPGGKYNGWLPVGEWDTINELSL